ncbi:MAG: glycoside hydrolase family 15 protein [bacterium]|nr:glycoside hydrolase family 15 protein [bacterium]
MYPKLEEYGMIGNCRSMALVSKWGSIDWAALPDFDSEAYFCKILDAKKGGYFDIHPLGFYQSSQIYKENTNILKTDFFNHSGRLILTDFMPLTKEEEQSSLVPEYGLKFLRRIKAKVGEHRIRLEIKVTPDFASKKADIVIGNQKVVFKSGKKRTILFVEKGQLQEKNGLVWSEFELKEGEEGYFAVGFFGGEEEEKERFDSKLARNLYSETRSFWEWWVGLCRYEGVFKTNLLRSALALKLLIFAPTGAVIAAPTTSLPEKLGGALNWDYRYVWLRDASFTMYALLGLGYLKEALEFMNWLEKVCLKEGKNIQIMYGLRGEKLLAEKELDHLSGYKNSKPVRVGNEAYKQRQLDVFGEVLSCINLFLSSGGKLSGEMKTFVGNLVNLCAESWKEEDAGIWEPRDGYQDHTYSKLMCWVGMDRGIKIAKKIGIEADFEFWEATRDEIKHDIIENGFDKDLQAFVEYYGSKNIDSSNLNIPLVGFLPASDPTVSSTLDRTMARLTREWFVYRTSNELDQLKAGEGAFFLSTFWVIDTLSALGRVKEAKIWLEKMVYFATPLGLYAEMFDPRTKEHLGNFPQAFTHLGFINSILNLKAATKFGAEKEATIQAERLGDVVASFNSRFINALEFLIPSAIMRSVSQKEKRRTRKHSVLGRLFAKIASEKEN